MKPGAGAGAAAPSPNKTAASGAVFAGRDGSLKHPDLDRRPYRRVTYDDLAAAGFENEVDFEALNVDLGRTSAPKGREWPIVAPSPELFGAVAGWRVESTPQLGGDVDAADAGGAGEGGAGGGGGGGGGVDVLLRDRNTYEPYRWMFAPLHERAAALEGRADEMVAALAYAQGAQGHGMAYGRIVPEADAARINKASVMLELVGASALGSGGGVGAAAGAGVAGSGAAVGGSGRLTLDLRELPSYSVFSGQIVGVKGPSMREGVMNVTEIAHRAPPPPVRVKKENAIAVAGLRQKSGPCRVIVAAGPYTAPGDLAFEPLQVLLAEVNAQGADVLVLAGPFVDADNEQVRGGAPAVSDGGQRVELTNDAIWSDVFLAILEAYLSDAQGQNVQVVLQPAVGDIIAEPVYPQWPLSPKQLQTLRPALRQRIVCVANPSTFVVGDLLWGMTSADPVFGMNADDATVNPPAAAPAAAASLGAGAGAGAAAGAAAGVGAPAAPPADRYTILARHILDQRSFYPLFPAGLPPVNAKLQGSAADAEQATRGMPLEVCKLWNLGLPACPDILVLPSRIGSGPQVRALGEHTLLINPGQLASRRSFARVLIFPDLAVAGAELEGQEYVTNRAQQRVRVDIERITVEEPQAQAGGGGGGGGGAGGARGGGAGAAGAGAASSTKK